jgi:DsbC/DsbD-like thiol-disulfide interchange protein
MKSKPAKLIFAIALYLGAGSVIFPQEWSAPAAVMQGSEPLISYRARLAGESLVLEASLLPGWHTFSIDNARRAADKLQGKKPLSQDIPTEILVSGGLTIDGPWHQSPPKDFSKPELRWFSWGYDERATFAVKTRRTGSAAARIAIRGQVCDASSCRRVDLSLQLPLPPRGSQSAGADTVWNSVEIVK